MLATADLICCEDTRRTRALLSAWVSPAGPTATVCSRCTGTTKPTASSASRALWPAEDVAVVSDAGTPGISDPGAWLASRLAAAGETVSTVPGPSSSWARS